MSNGYGKRRHKTRQHKQQFNKPKRVWQRANDQQSVVVPGIGGGAAAGRKKQQDEQQQQQSNSSSSSRRRRRRRRSKFVCVQFLLLFVKISALCLSLSLCAVYLLLPLLLCLCMCVSGKKGAAYRFYALKGAQTITSLNSIIDIDLLIIFVFKCQQIIQQY